MKRLLDPGHWGRALAHPLVLVGLLVDLLPVYAVFAWGWTAVPLVMLYWVENLVAGAMTLPRILVSGASFGGVGLLGSAFLSAFFVVHYGLFCFVHGTFLIVFASMSEGPSGVSAAPMLDMAGMVGFALESGLHIDWIVYTIAGFQAAVFVWEFMVRGEWKRSNPIAEMFSPYSRIVVLHIGIFGGAAALFLLGQPMVGVLALIVFRAAWGVLSNSKRFGLEAGLDETGGRFRSREQFEKLLKARANEL